MPPPPAFRSNVDSWTDSQHITSIPNMHMLAKKGDLEGLLKGWLINHNLILAPDELGNIPLHYAAMADQRSAARGLIALAIPENSWLMENKQKKTPMDLATSRIKKDMALISMKTAIIVDQHTQTNRRFLEERLAHPNENYKVLLSIDGGGIKAILIMGTILAIERALNGEKLMSRVHWLAGTSCGGIISLLLGCGYSAAEARKIFLRDKQETFCGNTARFPRHRSSGIEKTLTRYLGPKTKMGAITTHKIMVTAAKVKNAPAKLVLFRTYAPRIAPQEFEKYGFLRPSNVLVWKAARSTSAAPVFFESFRGLADGAIVCNNPCLCLMRDFLWLKKLESYKKIPNTDEIGAVVSLGSGTEPVVPLGGIDINLTGKASLSKYFDAFGKGKNLVTLFLYQCTSSSAVSAGQAREWAHSIGVPYFRLSPRLSKAIELDCTNLEGIFDFMFENEVFFLLYLHQFQVYLRTQARHDVQDLVRLLKSMPKNAVHDPAVIVQ